MDRFNPRSRIWRFSAVFAILLTCGCGSSIEGQGNQMPGNGMSAKDARWQRIVKHRRPPKELIDRIERSLREIPCVGQLSRWERHYFYGLTEDLMNVDESVVEFNLRQAGVHGFVPGRFIENAFGTYSNDDRQYDVVFGSYSVETSRLTIQSCGPNA